MTGTGGTPSSSGKLKVLVLGSSRIPSCFAAGLEKSSGRSPGTMLIRRMPEIRCETHIGISAAKVIQTGRPAAPTNCERLADVLPVEDPRGGTERRPGRNLLPSREGGRGAIQATHQTCFLQHVITQFRTYEAAEKSPAVAAEMPANCRTEKGQRGEERDTQPHNATHTTQATHKARRRKGAAAPAGERSRTVEQFKRTFQRVLCLPPHLHHSLPCAAHC